MECKVKWIGPDGMSFVAETESGHAFVMDGAPMGAGATWARDRMETVLAGTEVAPRTTWSSYSGKRAERFRLRGPAQQPERRKPTPRSSPVFTCTSSCGERI